MQALITGVGGFVGHHLAVYLAQYADLKLYGSVFEPVSTHQALQNATGITLQQVDLRDAEAVYALIEAAHPDFIFHLAALASVGRSWQHPWETIGNNVQAQLNILQALAAMAMRPRMLIIGSADQYGLVHPDENPISEDTPFRPNSPYSVSKIAQEMLGRQYFYSHQIPVICVRPFNHIGPGQRQQFVVPDFASQIAKAEAGLIPPVMSVGNLDAQRDFTDVRDVVCAYYLAITRGTPGAVYNIGSGKAHSIRALLDTLLDLSDTDITVKHDPRRMRPSDVPRMVCDARRLYTDTGWQPKIAFEQSLSDVLNEWRQRVTTDSIDT